MKIKISMVLLGAAFLSCLGTQAQDKTIESSSMPDTALYQISEKDKIVNIPFGLSYRKNLPGFVNSINPDEILKYDNAGTVNAALAGRVPGFITGTNLHGLGGSVVIIDGLPGSLSDVNINEVEQITVLKDANSAMFYGVQAGRGVIMITTKRGKVSDPIVEFIVEQGFSIPVSLPNYLGAADYMELYNEARANDGLPEQYSAAEIEGTRNRTNIFRFPDTDYHSSPFLKDHRPFSSYRMNYSGGSLKTQYFLNLGLNSNGSLLDMGENERSNSLFLRSNVNFSVNSYMNAFIDVAGGYDISKGPNGNFWNDAATLQPNLFTPLMDTSLVSNKDILTNASLVRGSNILGGTDIYRNNVYGNLLMSGYNRTYNSRLNYRTGIEIDLASITEGLSFKMIGSFTYIQRYSEGQNNTYAIYRPAWSLTDENEYTATLTKIGQDISTGRQSISNTFRRRGIGYYGLLDYGRTFADRHAVSASVLGFSNFDRQTGSLYETKFHHMGTRLNYMLDNKYIIDFSSVLTSALHLEKGNRIGFSPSLALGWVISEEDFFSGIEGINYMKLKASHGILNTDYDIKAYYLYRTSYLTSGSTTWNDGNRTNNYVRVSNLGNPNLGYEKRINTNVGAEVLLFKNSVWLDVNLFREIRSDLITQLISSTPAFIGGNNAWMNYGENNYSGVDLGLSYSKKTGRLGYELGGSFTYLRSEIVKTDETWENDYQFRAGKRTDGIWGLQADGLFMDDPEIAGHEEQSFGTVKPGDIKYIDQNSDGIIDANDMIMIGNSLPDFSFGLHLHLSYGNFSFFTLLTGSHGHESFANDEYYWVYGERKYSETVLDRWAYDPDKGIDTRETATYPRLNSGANSNNFRNSTFWLYDNSRLSINRMQLTYDIQPLAARLNAKNFGLYLRAENIAMFAKNRDKIQLNHNSEPQYVSYSIGIRAIF